jgi:site-specific recombinase XerD
MLPEITQFQQWLRRRNPQSSTAVHYGSDVSLFFAWLDKPIGEVTAGDVDAYISHCQTEGHAVATINRRLAALKAFYDYLAVMNEKAPANPVLLKRHYIRQGKRLPRDVEDKVLAQLFEAITSARDRAMFLLMLRCGLRVGEVRTLDLGDCYLHPAPGQLPRLWVRGKGGDQRVAYLSTQTLTVLQAWLDERPSVSCPAVFLNRFNERLTVTGIQLCLAAYCRRVGIWLTCHQLRHTFARHLVEAGVPVTSIQRLLGHARLRTTETYLSISDNQVQADYRAAMTMLAGRLALETGGE